MTYPAPFARLVASGTLYGVESFAFGLSIVPDFPGGQPGDGTLDTDALMPAVATSLGTYFTAVHLDNSAVLRMAKFNMIGANGRYLSSEETVLHEYEPGVAGVGSGNVAPQVALAVSLQTATARGRAHAGRFYLPLPGAQLQNDGLIEAAAAQAYADATTAFLNDLNDIVGGGWRVGVASDIGTGRFNAVTNVRVGRAYDTIRSRRRSMPEGYMVGAALSP